MLPRRGRRRRGLPRRFLRSGPGPAPGADGEVLLSAPSSGPNGVPPRIPDPPGAAGSELLLLGRDHPGPGRFTCRTLPGGRVAATISAGGTGPSPAHAYKGDPSVPNEDALLVVDFGDSLLLAIADAHFGAEASHELLTGLRDALPGPVRSARELHELLRGCGRAETGRDPEEDSATTLLVASLDRRTGRGVGLSYGDSSLVRIGGAGAPCRLNGRDTRYVAVAGAGSLEYDDRSVLAFSANPGDLLLAFTDGIDECHYRSPETSIGPGHLQELFGEIGPHPEPYARRLTRMALHGVGGHPGGQDNIALIVVAV